MADKITLGSIASFQNDTSAVTQYNANNALITTALNNTLSRDGTSPNQMSTSLDMNSNQILNLPGTSLTASGAAVRYIFSGINFNAGNTDTVCTFTLPAGVVRWKPLRYTLVNSSGNISTATAGVFTGPGGTGTALVAANTPITITTGAVNTQNNTQDFGGSAGAGNTAFTFTTVYFRVGTAQGTPATADFVLAILLT